MPRHKIQTTFDLKDTRHNLFNLDQDLETIVGSELSGLSRMDFATARENYNSEPVRR